MFSEGSDGKALECHDFVTICPAAWPGCPVAGGRPLGATGARGQALDRPLDAGVEGADLAHHALSLPGQVGDAGCVLLLGSADGALEAGALEEETLLLKVFGPDLLDPAGASYQVLHDPGQFLVIGIQSGQRHLGLPGQVSGGPAETLAGQVLVWIDSLKRPAPLLRQRNAQHQKGPLGADRRIDHLAGWASLSPAPARRLTGRRRRRRLATAGQQTGQHGL
jgi:hypothetical protein